MITTARMLALLANSDDNDGIEVHGGGTTVVGVLRHLLSKAPSDAEIVAYNNEN